MTRRRLPLRRRRRELGRRAPPPQSRLGEALDEILDRIEGGLVRTDRVALGFAARRFYQRLSRWDALGHIGRIFAQRWLDRHACAIIRDCMARLRPDEDGLIIAPRLNGVGCYPELTCATNTKLLLQRGAPSHEYTLCAQGGHRACRRGPGGGLWGWPDQEPSHRVLFEYAIWSPPVYFPYSPGRPSLDFLCAECWAWYYRTGGHYLTPRAFKEKAWVVVCARDHRAHRAPVLWHKAGDFAPRPPRAELQAARRDERPGIWDESSPRTELQAARRAELQAARRDERPGIWAPKPRVWRCRPSPVDPPS